MEPRSFTCVVYFCAASLPLVLALNFHFAMCDSKLFNAERNSLRENELGRYEAKMCAKGRLNRVLEDVLIHLKFCIYESKVTKISRSFSAHVNDDDVTHFLSIPLSVCAAIFKNFHLRIFHSALRDLLFVQTTISSSQSS